MKKLMSFLSLLICASISLSAVACQITVINNLKQPVTVMDGVKGDVDALGMIQNARMANQLYQSGTFNKYHIMPGQKQKIGHPHVHAHFLLGALGEQKHTRQSQQQAPRIGALGRQRVQQTKAYRGQPQMHWFEVSQYQCTGRKHETLHARQIVQQNLGKLSTHFGVKKLPN